MSYKKVQNINVIRSDSRVQSSMLTALQYLIYEIWYYRSHIKIIFVERFRLANSGTGFGIFWNYALPLIPLTVYWLLSALRIFPDIDGVSRATYITFGVTLWYLFAGCIKVPIQVIKSRNLESMKTNFPLSASIVCGFAQLLFETMVRLALVLFIIFTSQNWPTLEGLMLPFIVLPAIFMFTGIGLILGILNVIYNDISRVVDIMLQYGIFVSGVIFPLHSINILFGINKYNPFATFIDSSRSIVFDGVINSFQSYLIFTCLAFIFFFFSMRIFFIMEYRVRGVN